MDIVGWIKTNWIEAVFIAIGVMNSFIAGCRAAGWTRIADECQKLEDFVQASITSWFNRSKPPAGAAVLLLAMVTCSPAMAAEATAKAVQPPGLIDVMNSYGAQAGYFYGVRATHGYSYAAIRLVNVGPESWNLALDGGLIATSGVAVTLDLDLMKTFTLEQVPILGFFDTFRVGGGVMATDLTVLSDGSQINKVDTRLDYGADVLLSKTVKF
jgi:hypothetical protein